MEVNSVCDQSSLTATNFCDKTRKQSIVAKRLCLLFIAQLFSVFSSI